MLLLFLVNNVTAPVPLILLSCIFFLLRQGVVREGVMDCVEGREIIKILKMFGKWEPRKWFTKTAYRLLASDSPENFSL